MSNIAVIGAGLMGHGIALTFARAGHDVILTDPSDETRQSAKARISDSLTLLGAAPAETDATLSRVTLVPALPEAVTSAHVVFEAAPEKLELKQQIFADIEAACPADAILASNTSVIQISKIMGRLKSRHRAMGTHWWNPPHMIPLVEVVKTEWTDPALANHMQTLLNAVEVVKTEWTDPALAQAMHDLLADVGKTPVMVEKDVPGFIGNRLQHALWREAISLVENGICSAQAVDDVVKASFGRRLAVLGPLENADLVGLELTQDIHKQVLFDLENSPDPSPLLQANLAAGRTGMAAGKGLRDYGPDDLAATKARVAQHLRQLDGILPNDPESG